jgi:hypothetical protein
MAFFMPEIIGAFLLTVKKEIIDIRVFCKLECGFFYK